MDTLVDMGHSLVVVGLYRLLAVGTGVVAVGILVVALLGSLSNRSLFRF